MHLELFTCKVPFGRTVATSGGSHPSPKSALVPCAVSE